MTAYVYLRNESTALKIKNVPVKSTLDLEFLFGTDSQPHRWVAIGSTNPERIEVIPVADILRISFVEE